MAKDMCDISDADLTVFVAVGAVAAEQQQQQQHCAVSSADLEVYVQVPEYR